MKRASVILFAILLLAGIVLAAEPVKDPYDIQVKTLYSAPDESSNQIYSIPVEVKLLDVSEDGNWGKAKISFHLGPFGYTYVGWVHIPVGQILAEREKESQKLAKAAPPELTQE